ncbi:MAG: hypothetical protein AAF755_09335 [Pseudomonadota bacterium]
MAKRMFLEQRSYRMRRMMDAIRLLPLLGLALWMVPLMWPLPQEAVSPARADPSGLPTSAALRYVFAVWVGLALAAWLLWRRTRRADEGDAIDASRATD